FVCSLVPLAPHHFPTRRSSDLFARKARLFVGGDTGPLHLAAALGVNVVAIYGPTDPARNGPYGSKAIVLRDPESKTSHARHSDPDRKSTRLNSSHRTISYAVFC